jgi:hypothetical protein
VPGKLLKMLARWLPLMKITPGFDLSADFTYSTWAPGGFTESFAKELDLTWNIKLMIVAPRGIQTNFGSNVKLAPRHHAYDTHSSPLNHLLSYMSNPEVQSTFSPPKNPSPLSRSKTLPLFYHILNKKLDRVPQEVQSLFKAGGAYIRASREFIQSYHRSTNDQILLLYQLALRDT